jgi:ribosomal protein S21
MWVAAVPGESFERMYTRFKRGVESDGILREARQRRRFIPRHEERRERIRRAKRRQARNRG